MEGNKITSGTDILYSADGVLGVSLMFHMSVHISDSVALDYTMKSIMIPTHNPYRGKSALSNNHSFWILAVASIVLFS